MSVGSCAGGSPTGYGLPGQLGMSQTLSSPSQSLAGPQRPWEGGLANSAATHTGSCRGCWSPSWTAGWSGRPSGDPPCVRTENGTSCLHCPWNRSCGTEFRGDLLTSAQMPCSPMLVTHISGNEAMESHGSSRRCHIIGAG